MKPKSKEEIDEIRKSGKFMGKVISDGYSLNDVKKIIKKYSTELNKSFKDDSEYRVVDWLYEWEATPKFATDSFNDITLRLSKNKNIYTVSFMDNRNISKKKMKQFFQEISYVNYRDYQFSADFEYLEDALNFLKSCNIDTSKITRE